VEQTKFMLVLKHLRCRKYSFQNINPLSQGNKMPDAAASSIDGLFGEIHVFLQLGLFAGNRPYLHLEHLSCKSSSFQNLHQFSQGSNGLYKAASKIDDFLWRDTCISSTQSNRHICANRAYIHLENCDL
jgi:hypothetical protein